MKIYWLFLLSCRSEKNELVDETINQAPSIVILSPRAAVELVAGDTITAAAVVDDPDDDLETLQVAWYLGETLVCDFIAPNSDSSSLCDILIGDDSSSIRAEIVDSAGSSAAAQVYFSVVSWLGSRRFTNCYQDGRLGPSQAQCDTAYAGSALEAEVVVSSGHQQWTVPASGDYLLEVAGAAGGSVPGYPTTRGGFGATMVGVFSLEQGELLTIVVGQAGGDELDEGYGGGGGGGGSFVYTGAVGGEGLMIAAGGGAGEPEDNAYNGPSALTLNESTNGCGGGVGHGGGSIAGGGGGAGWLSAGQMGIDVDEVDGVGGGGQHWDGGSSGSFGQDNTGGFGGGGGGSNNESGGGGGYSGGCGSGDEGSGVGAGGSFNAGYSQSNSAGSSTSNGYVTIDKL